MRTKLLLQGKAPGLKDIHFHHTERSVEVHFQSLDCVTPARFSFNLSADKPFDFHEGHNLAQDVWHGVLCFHTRDRALQYPDWIMVGVVLSFRAGMTGVEKALFSVRVSQPGTDKAYVSPVSDGETRELVFKAVMAHVHAQFDKALSWEARSESHLERISKSVLILRESAQKRSRR